MVFLEDLTALPKAHLTVANHFPVQPGRREWGPREIPDYEFILQVDGTSRYRDPARALTLLR
mgnify:CR=1 FL=1